MVRHETTEEVVARLRRDNPDWLAKQRAQMQSMLAGTFMIPAKLCMQCGGWLVESRPDFTNFDVWERGQRGKRSPLATGTIGGLRHYRCDKCHEVFVAYDDLTDDTKQDYKTRELRLGNDYHICIVAFRSGEVPQPITPKQRKDIEEFVLLSE